jgi:phosphoribosyl-ATP pyrophosphohydrolase/phosphoribosyl-AMP cyclohydrolase
VVEREGTEGGLDVGRVTALRESVTKPVTAAGGVRSVEEIVALDRLGVDVQVGRALYTRTLRLGDVFAALMAFGNGNGRLPTVVQDAGDGRVLLVGESTPETLVKTIETGAVSLRAHRHAGAKLDHTQRLVRAEADCDRDALLFLVEPDGPACHQGTPSCFGERPFSLAALEAVIAERATAAEEGYTKRLLGDAIARHAKVMEEANELVEADTPSDARREAADLLYHTLVDLVARGVSLTAVIAELESRRRRPTA